jgi:F420-dependent oxidoreductase-like protein
VRIDILGWERTVDDAIAAARQAVNAGVSMYWLPRLLGLDPIVTLAVVARHVPSLGLGAGVVPVQTMHAMTLAQQSLTLSAASGGRFTLGVGLSHRPVVEGMWGLPFDRPITRMSEYLDALLPLLSEGHVAVSGETATAIGSVDIDAPPVPVLVAALGPQMLRLAGRRAAGTLTWMVGPATLAALTVPTIRAAAEEAGRPEPEIVAGFPVCVTEDPARALERAAARYQLYGHLPSYRAMLDREGAAGPADVAVVGSSAEVGERLVELCDLGVTGVAVSPFGSRAERQETWEVLAELAGL